MKIQISIVAATLALSSIALADPPAAKTPAATPKIAAAAHAQPAAATAAATPAKVDTGAGEKRSAPAAIAIATKAPPPSPATKKLEKEINHELRNNDVGIDQDETAGTDIAQKTPPAGTPPKVAAQYNATVHAKATAGKDVGLYKFDAKDYGVQVTDPRGPATIRLVTKDGKPLGNGTTKNDGTFKWSR